MHLVVKHLLNFWIKNRCDNRPLLLALSGGTDSLALFFALLELKNLNSLSFAVVHVDHAWRDESQTEMEILKDLVETRGITFHTKRLDPKLARGNLEAYCRMERIKYFTELCRNFHYQAVLTGHHGDDQAESTLKKLLEGSAFTHLQSLKEKIIFFNVPFWRPFLELAKHSLKSFLENYPVQGFEDSTNKDCRFMRAKFRHQIIPYLSQKYGKEVNASLQRIAQESLELDLYVEELFLHYQDCISQGPFGVYLDLSLHLEKPIWELKAVTRRFLEKEKYFLSHTLFSQLFDLIMQKKGNVAITYHQEQLLIDRGKLFIKIDSKVPLKGTKDLKEGVQKIGNWQIEVIKSDQAFLSSCDWRKVWKGEFKVILPKKDYILCHDHQSLAKWYGNAKIPIFFKNLIPVLKIKETQITHEFLTGRFHKRLTKEETSYEIKFKWYDS